MGPDRPEPMTVQEKLVYFHDLALKQGYSIEAALELASNIDGAHHKQWIIDQMVRALTGDDYDAWVTLYQHCGGSCLFHDGASDAEYCDEGYSWDEGIAP
jgi:hypothetical protein